MLLRIWKHERSAPLNAAHFFVPLLCGLLLYCGNSFAQGENKPVSSKKFFIELGVLATRSGPYNSIGNTEGRFARTGINYGALIGGGVINRLSQKFALQTAVQVSNISPYIFYGSNVREMSWYSSIDHRSLRSPATLNVASATLQLSVERIFKLQHAALAAGGGVAAHYVFNRNASTTDEPRLLAKSTLSSGQVKELILTQYVNRFAADIPVHLTLSEFKNFNRLRFTLQYNIAMRPRSNGSFQFDKDNGVATGRYRFIENTASFKLGWFLTR